MLSVPSPNCAMVSEFELIHRELAPSTVTTPVPPVLRPTEPLVLCTCPPDEMFIVPCPPVPMSSRPELFHCELAPVTVTVPPIADALAMKLESLLTSAPLL